MPFNDDGHERRKAFDQHLGARARTAREERRKTQQDVAKMLGLTFQQIQKYERGVNRMSASTLYELAQGLDVPLTYFFNGLPGMGTESDAEAAMHNIGRHGLELAELLAQMPPIKRQALLVVARNFLPEPAVQAAA